MMKDTEALRDMSGQRDATFFSQEELDFIINYDIKYRMGKAAEGAEEAEED